MQREKIIPVKIEDEMRDSYIDYSMSVIVSRALPDVRDGLKPVHRRVLYAMSELGLQPGRAYKKSARVVGEVLGKYHPHGDTAVYDALVRMAQEFSLRYPLIDGQGNFGSIDGDSPAAMRYTEVRMQRVSADMLKEIDKNTIDFSPNFDDSLQEPVVLPSAIPNLLVNGASGIAVGMATNIPPHNLTEVVDGLIAYIDNPDIDSLSLMNYVKAPDFPTAGIIYGYEGVKEAYTTGRGKIIVRARAVVETNDRTGKDSIVITELPYQVNKAKVLEKTAALVNDKKIEGISDLRDESDRDGTRIVLELKKGTITRVVINLLFKHTQLQDTFGVIMLVLVKGHPKVLTLKEMMAHYIDHRHEVLLRRTRFELNEAEKRAHILEGLKLCLDNLDEVIKLIRKAKDPETAKKDLITRFSFSDVQAKAILDMRLQRLTGLEREKIENEYKELIKLIEKLNVLLKNRDLQMKQIQSEIVSIKEKYGDKRRTEIIKKTTGSFSMESLIADEDVVIIITTEGYIKRTPVSSYRRQSRGGRGVSSGTTNREDAVEHLIICSTHDYILFFTSAGRCYWLKVYDVPEAGRTSRGRAISNVVDMLSNETVSAFIHVKEFKRGVFILMATRKGSVKKTSLAEYAKPRRGGIIAVKLDEKDQLVGAETTNGSSQVLLTMDTGLTVRFHERDIRPTGRNTSGVKGISLQSQEKVVSLVATSAKDTSLLTVTTKGFGKQTRIDEYRMTKRGARGVSTLKETGKVGKLVGVVEVEATDDIIITTENGIMIRQSASSIRSTGRHASGVKLINLTKGDKVISVIRVPKEEVRD